MPKQKSAVFPYGITLREEGRVDIFPAAEVGFRNKEGYWLTLYLVIDSGATISALPSSDALVFGIDVEQGMPQTIAGIDGHSISGWQHEIQVQIGEISITLPFVFLNSNSVPRVLGRTGIFERFTIVFEEKRKRTGFLREGISDTRSIQKLLDRI